METLHRRHLLPSSPTRSRPAPIWLPWPPPAGDVLIRNVIPKHMDCITAKLLEMGVHGRGVGRHRAGDAGTGPSQRTNVKTLPYPGFPTDMQPQIAAVLSLAQGTSLVTEGVYGATASSYVDELRRMGAQIQVDGKVAVIEGVEQLNGAPVQACDLRAGAALVIAGLAAQGVTQLEPGAVHRARL